MHSRRRVFSNDALNVTMVLYNQNPTSRSFMDVGAGYSALRIPGATSSDSATIVFDFPATSLGPVPPDWPAFHLLYFNGSFWAPVLSSGGAAPERFFTYSDDWRNQG